MNHSPATASSVEQATPAARSGVGLAGGGGTAASVVRRDSDLLTVVLLLVLVGAWLAEGTRILLGLPHVAVGVIDAAEAVVCAWLALQLVRERRMRLFLVIVPYVAWVLTGLIGTTALPGSVVTALKDALLLPVFALLVASRGGSEKRARLIAYTLLGLCAFEFVLTFVQLLVVPNAAHNPDLIVGSFGPNNNAVTGVLILLVSTVGVAAFVTSVRYGAVALAMVCTCLLFSAWAYVKGATLLLPLAALLVSLTALHLRLTTRRRAAIGVLVALVSSGVVFGAYAAFSSRSFGALTTSSGLSNYLATGSVSGSYLSTWNADTFVAHPVDGRGVYRLVGRSSGPYSAGLTIPVRPGIGYEFSPHVAGVTGGRETIQPWIEWLDSDYRPIVGVTHAPLISTGHDVALRPVLVAGVAPVNAAYATPTVGVIHPPASGSAILISRLALVSVPKAMVAGTQSRLQPSSAAPTPAQPALQGHLTLLRLALHTITGSPSSQLFGNGLGYATVSSHLGVTPGRLSPERFAAGKSDFGRLVAERGWSGVLITILFGFFLIIVAIRTGRSAVRGRWSTAFTVAVPAAVVMISGYGLIADNLAIRPTALTFWLIVALGLSQVGVLQPGRR